MQESRTNVSYFIVVVIVCAWPGLVDTSDMSYWLPASINKISARRLHTVLVYEPSFSAPSSYFIFFL